MMSKTEERIAGQMRKKLERDVSSIKEFDEVVEKVRHMPSDKKLFSNVWSLFELDGRIGLHFLKRISERPSYAPYYSMLAPVIKVVLEKSDKRQWEEVINDCVEVMEKNLLFKTDFDKVKENMLRILKLVEEEGLNGFKKGIEEAKKD